MTVSSRGEAAWKQARERVAQRNAAARKTAKQQLVTHDRHIAEGREKARRERGANNIYTR